MPTLKARKISNLQERKLLRQLKNAELISNGSSRLVFIDPRNENRVVKVAIGACALRQNRFEIQLWNSRRDERLARIYEYGVFTVTMEKIECTFDDDDLEDEEGLRVVEWLNEILGETSDNFQIGCNADGEFKAYDYGFDPQFRSWEQVGHASQFELRKDYRWLFNKFIGYLNEKTPVTKMETLMERD